MSELEPDQTIQEVFTGDLVNHIEIAFGLAFEQGYINPEFDIGMIERVRLIPKKKFNKSILPDGYIVYLERSIEAPMRAEVENIDVETIDSALVATKHKVVMVPKDKSSKRSINFTQSGTGPTIIREEFINEHTSTTTELHGPLSDQVRDLIKDSGRAQWIEA